MSHQLNVLQSWLASGARLNFNGVYAQGHAKKPEKPLELYEFEGCPFCRKVREALTTLDLDVMIYPCPKGGTIYREKVREMGGKTQFPFLVDPNRDVKMYESDDIITYLFKEYGGRSPGLQFSKPMTAGSFLVSATRPMKGSRKRPSKQPAKALELYSFEASPFSRVVRETLSELELPYLLHNVGKGGTIDWLLPPLRQKYAPKAEQTTENRKAFVARSGKMQVPYLIDPNTGAAMFESDDIVKYLNDTYAL